MDLMQLGKLLAEARIRSGLSQRAAAKSAGISAAYVRTLEISRNPKTGRASQPAQDKLRRLCRVVGLDLERALPLAGYDSTPVAGGQPETDVPARVAVDELIRELHEAAKGLSQRNAFLQNQIVDRLSGFAEDFGAMTSGTIRYSAEQEPELTQNAVSQTKRQISAVSYQDEEWWLGSQGQNYLRVHAEALTRGIRIARVFLVPLDRQVALTRTFQSHLDLRIETFVLDPDDVNELLRSDFVVYDDLLLRTGRPIDTPSERKGAVFTDDKALIRQALKDFRELRKLAVARGADVESVLGRLR